MDAIRPVCLLNSIYKTERGKLPKYHAYAESQNVVKPWGNMKHNNYIAYAANP